MDAQIKEEGTSFAELKLELQKTQSLQNILKLVNSSDVKSFTKEQFGYVCEVIQAKISEDVIEIPDALRFLEWLQSIASKKGLEIRCLVLVLTLKFVNRFLTSRATNRSQSEESDIQAMITSALRNMNDFQLSSMEAFKSEDRELLQKVLELLFGIVVLKPPFIEIKIILDLWKSYSNIFMAFIKQTRLVPGASIDDIKQILDGPIKFLLQEVGRSIDLIYRVQALQQPIEQIEKYLRIINFYIKILRIFVAAVKHKDFGAAHEFFESHKKSRILPKHLEGTEIASLIEKNVQNDFDLLSKYVYQHPEVFKLLMAFLNESPVDETWCVVKAYFSAVLLNEDSGFIASKTAEFIKIFNFYFNDPKSHGNSYFYDSMVAHFSALTMLDESPNLLAHFRGTILEENFWLATASSDILILIQRFQKKHLTQSKDALLSEFHFWRDCYSRFALFSDDIKQIHVLKLMKNCLELCAPQILPRTHMFSEDIRFLLANNLSSFETETKNCNSELNGLLRDLSAGNGTIESYYKTIFYLKLLYNSMDLDEQTMKSLVEVTERLLRMDTEQSKVFSLFVNASLKLISKYAEKTVSLDEGKLLAHVQTPKQVATFPGAIRMLHAYSRSPSLHVRQRANAALKQSFIDTSGDCDGDFESLTEIIDSVIDGKYIHSCPEYYAAEEPQSKRKCFEYRD